MQNAVMIVLLNFKNFVTALQLMLVFFMAERMGFSSCYRKVHRTFLLKIFAFGSIFRATCSHPIIIKKTQANACVFYGGEDGILFLLSKGAPHLSPKNFRLSAQFLEPRLRIPIFYKRKKSIKMILFFLWRRGWDSNPCGFWPNGFQDRLVMTASIPLRICSNILSQE